MKLPNLEILDEDSIQELDRDIAVTYYRQNNIPLPGEGILKKKEIDSTENKPVESTTRRKSVKFSNSIDDDGRTWQDEELKKMGSTIADLTTENYKLKQMLDDKKYS